MAKKKSKPRKARPIHPNTTLLSVEQAAVVLNLGATTVRRMLNEGQLPVVVPRSSSKKRLIRVSRRALDEFLEREEKRGRP
jgi:excisionase family DNA binding protein